MHEIIWLKWSKYGGFNLFNWNSILSLISEKECYIKILVSRVSFPNPGKCGPIQVIILYEAQVIASIHSDP